MDSPNSTYSLRISRHDSVPCKGTATTTSTSSNTTTAIFLRRHATAAILKSRRLGASKNNPYVGSFRHAPPTSFRSMELSGPASVLLSPPPVAFLSSTSSGTTSTTTTTPTMTTRTMMPLSSPLATMKNSPYVGWFRHAPPTSTSSTSSRRRAFVVIGSSTGTNHPQQQQQQQQPPLPIHFKVDHEFLTKVDRWHQQLAILLEDCSSGSDCNTTNKKETMDGTCQEMVFRPCLSEMINGKLVGGGKGKREMTTPVVSPLVDPLFSSTSSIIPSVTSKFLSRLGSWLLFPLIMYDDEDVTACYNEYRRAHSHHNNGLKLLEDDYDARAAPDTDSDKEEENNDDRDDSDDDDDGSSTSSSVSLRDIEGQHRSLFTRTSSLAGVVSSDLVSDVNVSVSEIAESYYAHQLIEERRNAIARTRPLLSGDGSGGLRLSTDPGHHHHHPLDYVITQMDIARMARNASRHLDVDSILTLPTITYRKSIKTGLRQRHHHHQQQQRPPLSSSSTPSSHKRNQQYICGVVQENNQTNETNTTTMLSSGQAADSWSFVMVSGMKSTIMVQPPPPTNIGRLPFRRSLQYHQEPKEVPKVVVTEQEVLHVDKYEIEDNNEAGNVDDNNNSNDMCVICLDSFQDGDRLRVLPCSHSFHVGCIDRWLSGSHSYNECFTAGCPTCKKRPSDMMMRTIVSAPTETTQNQELPAEVGATTTTESALIVPPPQSTSKKDVTTSTAQQQQEQDIDDYDLDGSVPSWAFAQLGSVMAMSSGDLVFDD